MVNPTLKFSGNPGSYRPPRVALLPSAILRFFDASTGIGVSEPMRAVNAHGRGILLKTTDGGQTWTQVRKLDEFAYGVFISFINQRIGYLAGSGRLWITHDGGITLEEVGRFPWNTGGIDFATADVGWYTDNNQIYRTSDGGKTWPPIPLGYRVLTIDLLTEGYAWIPAEDCNGKICKPLLLSTADGNHGWFSSEDRLWSTVDGRQSWTKFTSRHIETHG